MLRITRLRIAVITLSCGLSQPVMTTFRRARFAVSENGCLSRER